MALNGHPLKAPTGPASPEKKSRQSGVTHKLLAGLMPQLFDNEETQEIDEDSLVFYLCRLLKVLRASLLPTVTHEVEPTVEDLLAALSQHFAAIGGLVGPQTLENLRKGYYDKDESGKNIICREDPKEEKTKLKLDHCDEVGILNTLDPQTEIRCVTNGVTMKIDSMYEELMNAQVPLPTVEVEWQGALFGSKKPMKTPEKRKAMSPRDSPQSAGADPNAFASKSSVMLQDALRRKMSKKAPAAKGSGASGSASGSK